jgi:hypothetical protein
MMGGYESGRREEGNLTPKYTYERLRGRHKAVRSSRSHGPLEDDVRKTQSSVYANDKDEDQGDFYLFIYLFIFRTMI